FPLTIINCFSNSTHAKKMVNKVLPAPYRMPEKNNVSKLVRVAVMTSPYQQKRLRSLDEAVEENLLKELRHRHKANDAANRQATVIQTGNDYRLGPRVVSKFGDRH
ncbi:MAG: hypothetical protein VCE74_21675, partial [Alphaproteobacteria bacterium]